MGKLYRYLKGRKGRSIICFALVLTMTAGGFMGIQSFRPEERKIDISDYNSEAVSLDMTVSKEKEGVGGEASGMTAAAKGAVLMDAGSGTLLFAQSENERLPPASVTKVMTMLLILEAVDRGQISLSDNVTVSEKAASMGGSQMYMEPGEQHTLEELMKGIAMVSANDACVACAEYLSGSVDIFVENMNKRAAELGMENSNFINTNGLPVANHYSSAKDIAIMSRELLKYMEGHTWFTDWQDQIKVGLPGKETDFGLTNTNKLIKQYPGAIGIKTGFTQDAGYCLSGAATKGDMTLIAVVLGCETTKIRFAEISKLLDYGFANYDTAPVAAKNQIMGQINLEKGSPETINAVSKEKISILVKKGEKDSITSAAILAENISLPLKKGDKVGELVIMQEGQEIDRRPLSAEESAEEAGFTDIYARMLKKFIPEG